jgi:hypothetical protein
MYHIEWIGPPPHLPEIFDSTEVQAATIEIAMAHASGMFPEVSLSNPKITGYRICKKGEPALITWWSPEATADT